MVVLGLLHTLFGYLSTFGFVALAVPLIALALLLKARQNSAGGSESVNDNNNNNALVGQFGIAAGGGGDGNNSRSSVTQTIYELPAPPPSSSQSPESPIDTKSNNELQLRPQTPTPNNRRSVAPSKVESAAAAENKLASPKKINKYNILVFKIDKNILKFNETDKSIIVHPLKRIVFTFLENLSYLLSLSFVDQKIAQLEIEKDWRSHLLNTRSRNILASINGCINLIEHTHNKNHDHDLFFDASNINLTLNFKVKLPSGVTCDLKVSCNDINGKLNLNLNLANPYSATLYWGSVQMSDIQYDIVNNAAIDSPSPSQKLPNSDILFIENFIQKIQLTFKSIKGEYLLNELYKITQINTLNNPAIIKHTFDLKKSKYAYSIIFKSILINSPDCGKFNEEKKICVDIKSGSFELKTEEYEIRPYIVVMKEFAIPYDSEQSIRFDAFVDRALYSSGQFLHYTANKPLDKSISVNIPLNAVENHDLNLSITVDLEMKFTYSRDILDSQYDKLQTYHKNELLAASAAMNNMPTIKEEKEVRKEKKDPIPKHEISNMQKLPEKDLLSTHSDFDAAVAGTKKKSYRRTIMRAFGLKKKKPKDGNDTMSMESRVSAASQYSVYDAERTDGPLGPSEKKIKKKPIKKIFSSKKKKDSSQLQ